ncbi:MAG: hypothetical protein AB1Z98_14575 [Nannocystaceae bacterium]
MARRRVSRRLTRPKSRDCVTPDRLPHPCYYLCSECGWLQDGRVGDPHRSTAGPTAPGACPSCSETAWVDLGLHSTALGYLEAEAAGREIVDDRSLGRASVLGLGIAAAVIAGLSLRFPDLPGNELLMPLIGMATALAVAFTITTVRRALRRSRARARRWRRPLPQPLSGSRTAGVTHGVVDGEATRRTPLGGEPCVGWAIQVWSDEGLLLDEQSHAELTIEGQHFEADTVTLDLACRHRLQPNTSDPAFVRFMQRRGLSPHDLGLRIYEAHLRPGVPVALVRNETPRGSSPVLSQAPRDLAA